MRIRKRLLAAAGLAGLLWNLEITAWAAAPVHNPRFADCRVEYGIDVSYHQEEIDWERARSDGVRFAFIRVARRASLDGSLAVDIRAFENIEGAYGAGIPIGVYIYSQAVSAEEAVEEADYILAAIEPYRDMITLPVVMDYEFSDLSGNRGRLERANLSKRQGTQVCLAFCRRVEENGYTPMVYANETMLTHYLEAEAISDKYPIWLANHTFETSYEGEYSYWQYTSRGRVDGIQGNVDLNVHYVRPEEDMAVGEDSPPLEVDEGVSSDTPELTAVVAGPEEIDLSWTRIVDASGYELERFDWKEGTYVVIAKLQGTDNCTYRDMNLTPGTKYIYRVRMYVTGEVIDDRGPYSAVSQVKLPENEMAQMPWHILLPVTGAVLLVIAVAAAVAVLVARRFPGKEDSDEKGNG